MLNEKFEGQKKINNFIVLLFFTRASTEPQLPHKYNYTQLHYTTLQTYEMKFIAN